MISDAALVPEILGNDVCELLRVLTQEGHWTNEKGLARTKLIQLLDDRDFYYFRGDPRRYALTGIGKSEVLSVPPNKRGHLQRFRGEQVCLVCVGTGRFDRGYMAGGVKPSRSTMARLLKAREALHLAEIEADKERERAAVELRLEKNRKGWRLPHACGDLAFYRYDRYEILLERLSAAGLDRHVERIRNAMRQ